jgi:hypothetical protein
MRRFVDVVVYVLVASYGSRAFVVRCVLRFYFMYCARKLTKLIVF